MKRPLLALACLAALGSSQAAIAPGSTGDGELFFNIHDAVAKVSYVLDLGIRMDEFFVVAQQELGYQRFWVVDSDNWTRFLDQTDLVNLQWSVVAIDSTGNTAAGGHRLYTTVRQGSEGVVANYTNQNLTNGTGATQAGNFFTGLAGKGTHGGNVDYAVHGDSVALETDAGRGYYGEAGGLTPNFNGTSPFNATNRVGESSWFYYLTRSSAQNLTTSRVLVDEFDNLGHDGYWGFVKVENQDSSSPFYDPASPFAGKYLLSFTMPVFDLRTTADFRSFAQGIGRTEYSGGMVVQALSGAAATATLEQAAGWVTLLGAALPSAAPAAFGWSGAAASPVPEPGSWALLLAGGLSLLARHRAGRRAA